LINEHVVLYKSAGDVTICLVGRGEDSNELLLYSAVETIFEALSEIIKYNLFDFFLLTCRFRPQLDKKSLLEQFDLLALTVDEVIDKG
jgi:coatomer subunit zeta